MNRAQSTSGEHTPGPWETGTPGRGRFCVYAPKTNGRGICVMSNTQSSWDASMVAKHGEHPANIEADANAALIASAPDMLNAITRLAEKVRRANAIQHSGGEVTAEDWSELYALQNEAFGVVAIAKGQP